MKTKFKTLSFLVLLTTFCNAQNPNIDSAKTAMLNLANLSNNTTILTNVVNGCNLNSTQIVTVCKVCSSSHWYCFGCCEYTTWTYTWNFPDYTNFMNSFKSYNVQLLNDINTFKQNYQPLQSWFLNSLPPITQNIQTLKSSTPDNVLNNLQNTITNLSNASSQLNNAINSLNNWNNTIANDFNNINSNSQNLQYYFTLDSNKIINYTTTMQCGQDDLKNQWNSLKATVVGQMANFTTTLNNTGISTNSINQNLACINGPLIALQFKLNGVLNELQSSQITPSVAIQKLQILVSVDLWNQLAQFAQQEFVN